MILVSACLLGQKVKYDGGDNLQELLKAAEKEGHFVSVCPETAGGLPRPREPVEIQKGTGEDVLEGCADVQSPSGKDCTKEFLNGAQSVLETAKRYHARVAILKESSPSCGSHTVYDGTFTHKKIEGQGVCAALLKRNGIRLYSEKDMTEELLKKLIEEDV